MSRYADLDSLKRYISVDGTVDDGLLQECLDRAENTIEDFTRRQFVGTVGTIFASRYDQHHVNRQAFWLQDDLFSLQAMTLGDGRVVPVGSVWLEPREGPPYRAIRLKSAYAFSWNTDQDMIIVGTLGYSTIAPLAITHATIRLATKYYREKDQGGATEVIGSDMLGQQTVPRGIPQDVYDLLIRYRSRTGGVV